jgi:nitroimidazol reductase NimA-like FMN-containing flavoprotein (pyridoxamine 5'-phosphate oxidase superfamily)
MSKAASTRIRVRRAPKRARYECEWIWRVLDRGRLAHVAFVDDGQPFCIPTLYARVGDRVLIHGSSASRMVRRLAAGAPACVTVTILDGMVLARSAFEHSVNYDSAVLVGTFEPITDPAEKLAALEALLEGVLPGRWREVRPPNRKELKATAVLAMQIGEASVKTRSAPPDDDSSPDAELDTWAGVIPIQTSYGTPEPSPGLRPGISASPGVERLIRQDRKGEASNVRDTR